MSESSTPDRSPEPLAEPPADTKPEDVPLTAVETPPAPPAPVMPEPSPDPAPDPPPETPADPRTPSSWSPRARAWLVVALAFVLSTFAWWTALDAFPHTQGGDGPQYHKMLEAAKWTLLRYHEFPGWNPYECGGLPLWDNPQAFVGAPLAWLTFLLGTTRTMEVWYVVHGALGFLSMWLLVREDLRLSRLASFIGSAMWAWNGFHQQHYGNGHSTFVPFLYFPLALFLWRRAERDPRYAVGLGMLVAWMMYEGAVYPLPHLVVFLGVETLTRVWPPRRTAAIAKASVLVVLVGFGLAASRFIPVMHQLKIHNRGLHPEIDYLRWHTIRDMFLFRDSRGRTPGQEWGWHEYGAYVGPFLLFCSLVGMLVAGTEYVWLYVLFVFFFAMMSGHFARWAPWEFLHAHVFPFKEMRVPSRFRSEVVLTMSIFAAIAIDRLPRRLPAFARRYVQPDQARAGLALLALLGVGDMIGAGLTRYPLKFNLKPSVHVPASAHLYLGGKGLAQFIDQPQQNRGRIKCWDEWGFEAGAALWQGDVPQVRPADEQVGKVLPGSRRTPNTFTFVYDSALPSRALLNSSYDDGWHSSIGAVVRQDHLLAIDLPAGRSVVKVRYWPYGLTAGLVVSAVSFVLVGAFFGWDAWRRRTRPPAPDPVSEEPAPEGGGS